MPRLPQALLLVSALATGDPAASLELRRRARTSLDRDTEIAVEILCGDFGRALGRIRRRAQTPVPSAASLVLSELQTEKNRVA